MKFDYAPIVEAILKLCLAVVSAFVIPILIKKLDNEKAKKLIRYIDIFVGAAEQLFSKDQTAEKKSYVMEGLQELGYSIDTITDDQVEAAVLKLHNELAKGLYKDDIYEYEDYEDADLEDI